MNCVSPLTIRVTRNSTYKLIETFEVPCGHCINCLIQKQSALEFLAKKELLEVYKRGQGASFVTLTYDDNHIPRTSDGLVTLRKHDLQCWFKNMRRQMEYYNEKIPFKYIACGEYGDSLGRSHYHIVFLGLTDVQVAKYTKKLWKYGLCDIGVLGQGGLRYVCKYLTKQKPPKVVKEMREKLEVENPFLVHSFGLGKKWILDNVQKIADDNFQFSLNGKLSFYPSYVCRFVSLRTGKSYKRCIQDFNVKRLDKVHAQGHTLKSFDDEQRYLRYQNNIACLRSKGITVDPKDLEKIHWVKPKHKLDRQVFRHNLNQLADLAIYGDVVPF